VSQRADNRADARHVEWMRTAIAAATATRPHPNPRVGAVVVAPSGEVASVSAHSGPGRPHAEAAALSAAGELAGGGTLVVTLEPCNHHGRTPPCTEAIITSGIAVVVVAAVDPDDRVSGSGIERLRAAGVRVVTGVLAADAIAIDQAYHHHRTVGRPRFTLKLAVTLDGQVAAADRTSQWITSEEARLDVHGLRAATDAVLVGAGTLRSDDPRLDVRVAGYEGPQPRPVIAAGLRELPGGLAVYGRSPIVYAPRHHGEVPADIEQVVLWHPSGVDLGAMAKDLGERGLLDILVEGGPTLARAMLIDQLVDRIVVYVGALLAGGAGLAPFGGAFRTIADAKGLVITDVTRLGPDLRIDAELEAS